MSIFVTATGTEVGKTFFSTVWMLKYGIVRGWKYWKPVETGVEIESDFLKVKSYLGEENTISPVYQFQYPASPHYAAALENSKVDFLLLEKYFYTYASQKILIEGAGGVYVPLNEEILYLDFLEKFKLHFIVISSTELGTINHTLLTIEAIQKRKLPILGFYMIGKKNKLFESNYQAIERFSKVTFLGVTFLPEKKLSQEELSFFAYNFFDKEKKMEKYL
jgi:dethiobiotin synthetase